MSRRLIGIVFIFALVTACNAILGNEEHTRASDQGSGAATGGGSSGQGGSPHQAGNGGNVASGGDTGSGDTGSGGDTASGGDTGGGDTGSGGDTANRGGTAGKGGSNGGMAGDAGTGGGECTNGETRCSPAGLPERCSGGSWESQALCDAATPVCLEGACVVCAPQSYRCVGKRLDQCSDALAWETVKTCLAAAPVCNPVAGDCLNLVLQGGLSTLALEPTPNPSFNVRGELTIVEPACNAGTVCVRGGIAP